MTGRSVESFGLQGFKGIATAENLLQFELLLDVFAADYLGSFRKIETFALSNCLLETRFLLVERLPGEGPPVYRNKILVGKPVEPRVFVSAPGIGELFPSSKKFWLCSTSRRVYFDRASSASLSLSKAWLMTVIASGLTESFRDA